MTRSTEMPSSPPLAWGSTHAMSAPAPAPAPAPLTDAAPNSTDCSRVTKKPRLAVGKENEQENEQVALNSQAGAGEAFNPCVDLYGAEWSSKGALARAVARGVTR